MNKKIDTEHEGEISNYQIVTFDQFGNSNVGSYLEDIDKRLNDLENKVFPKTKKTKLTRAQQFLLLHHLPLH